MKSKLAEQKLERLRELTRESARLLKEFEKPAPIIMSGLSQVYRTCGKPYCRCAEKPYHLFWILNSVEEGGRKRCQVVRRDDESMVKEKVDRYRHLKKVLREVRALDSKRNELIKEIMKACHEPYK